jgi:hypothetical protein
MEIIEHKTGMILQLSFRARDLLFKKGNRRAGSAHQGSDQKENERTHLNYFAPR